MKIPVCYVRFQDTKCNLTVLLLVDHPDFRDGATCNSCNQPIGQHIYQHGNLFFQWLLIRIVFILEVVKEISKSNTRHEVVNIKITDYVNYKYDGPIPEEESKR